MSLSLQLGRGRKIAWCRLARRALGSCPYKLSIYRTAPIFAFVLKLRYSFEKKARLRQGKRTVFKKVRLLITPKKPERLQFLFE